MARSDGVLGGVRALAFTTGVAGPNTARILAQCGAEVIKVESMEGGLDSFRYFAPSGNLDASPRFIEANLNVMSAQLNLKHPDGVRLALELVGKSDVVLDNFRPDVLPRLGLGPEALRRANPSIVVVKMPGLGSTGPKSRYGTWGSTLTAFSGMTSLWNHPAQPRPVGSQGVYPDYLSASFVPAVVVAALLYRKRTGRGVYLDIAQMEVTAYALGVSFLEALFTGRDPEPIGNDWPWAAPHNCYPCRGEDRWCVISVQTDEQWSALCEAIGHPELAEDPRYATLMARRRCLDEIDQLVAGWTRGRSAETIMSDLQGRGIPCGVVQTGHDLCRDPHLLARGFISAIEHPVLGHMRMAALPLHLSRSSLKTPRPPARLGEQNEYVFCEILGYSHDQLRSWQNAGIVR